jgi:hypothetical protein
MVWASFPVADSVLLGIVPTRESSVAVMVYLKKMEKAGRRRDLRELAVS